MLADIQHQLKSREFIPVQVRQKAIPNSGKIRHVGIPTTADRIVQAALKLVLEPIFEADFKPSAYGFGDAGHRTPSLRFTSWEHPPVTTSGCSRLTSKRASTKSTTRP